MGRMTITHSLQQLRGMEKPKEIRMEMLLEKVLLEIQQARKQGEPKSLRHHKQSS
jgi:hypothetical protein